MPTSKRKVNTKRWKQLKTTGKRFNDRLEFNPGARSGLTTPPFLPLVYSPTCLPINFSTHQPAYSPTCLLAHLATYPLAHSSTCLPTN